MRSSRCLRFLMAGLGFLTGCSLGPSDDHSPLSRIEISFAPLYSHALFSFEQMEFNLFQGKRKKTISTPTQISDFDCLGVIVTGSQISSNADLLKVCSINMKNGMPVPGILGGFIPSVSGGTIDVEVPGGPSRLVQVFGVQSNIECPLISDVLKRKDDFHDYSSSSSSGASANEQDLGDPYELARSIQDIYSDISLNLKVTYQSDKKIFQCGEETGSSGSGSTETSSSTKYYFYNTDANTNTISAFVLDITTGKLSLVPGSAFSTATYGSPFGIAVDPTYTYLYVSIFNASASPTGQIVKYGIDKTTGELTDTGSSTTTVSYAKGIAIDPSGSYLYVNSSSTPGSLDVFQRNSTTGSLTQVSGAPFVSSYYYAPDFMVLDSTGQHLYSSSPTTGNNLYFWPLMSGVPSAGGLQTYSALTTKIAGLAVDPQGNYLYLSGSNGTNNSIDRVFLTSATGVPVAGGGSLSPGGNQAQLLVMHPTGNFIYTPDFGLSLVLGASINTTGMNLLASTAVGNSTGLGPVQPLIDPDGLYLYVLNSLSNTISGYSIDASTGALTPLSGSPFPTGGGPMRGVIIKVTP